MLGKQKDLDDFFFHLLKIDKFYSKDMDRVIPQDVAKRSNLVNEFIILE